MKCKVLAAVVGCAAFLGSAKPSHAWSYSSEGQWASVNYGIWTVYNDVWGNSNPSQWLNANSASNWEAVSDQTGGGVKSYANVQYDFAGGKAISSFKTLSASFNISTPSSGSVYDWIFDDWTGTPSSLVDEVEIYEKWTTPTGGWGTEIASNVSIGGTTWSQVWQVNDGHNILMFFRGSQRTSGTENVLSIFQWAANNHHLNNTNFSNHDFGVEVTSTTGWQTFEVNSWSSSWS